MRTSLRLIPALLFASATLSSAAAHISAFAGISHSTYQYEAKSMWNPNAVDRGFRTGFSGGIGFIIPLHVPLQIETGLVYDRKGGSVTLPGSAGPRYKIEYSLDYLSIPLCVRLPLTSPHLGPYLKIGTELGILLSARNQYRHLDSSEFRDIDVGIVGSAGLVRAIRGHDLFVELAYVHGLLDVVDPPAPILFEAESFNREVRVSLGFRP